MLGVDAFPKGWVGVLWAGPGTAPSVRHGRDLTALMAVVDALGGPPEVIGIDIPVALPESGQRRSDLAVRALLGPRRASLFMTPVRAAVTDDDWATASAHQRALAGSGMSKQAHALRHSIRQAMDWASSTGRVLHEVHPETSFAFLASGGAPPPAPMAASKQTWAGAMARRSWLVAAGLALPDDIGPTGAVVPPIDVLDAAAAAWSAWRIASGEALSWPADPEPGEALMWA
ncbi:MAG: hypothetical protein JWN61_1521 [Pseudonocardiales bacterium]|nr:hypothetical protein [Pseudonocardiales bacterium]